MYLLCTIVLACFYVGILCVQGTLGKLAKKYLQGLVSIKISSNAEYRNMNST